MIGSFLIALSLVRQTHLPFLSPCFGDRMVLQRGMKNTLWGWTTPGAEVKVSVGGHTAKAAADGSGKWVVKISPPPVGGPYRVAIDGPEHVVLDDVLVGDVWICSGQSNMEFGIGNATNGAQEISSATYPNIRLAMVPRDVQFGPKPVANFSWEQCGPSTVSVNGWNGFSAVGYFFGRELHKRLGVPIGLIQTCWGGTIAEAWTSKQGLSAMHEFDAAVAGVDQKLAAGTKPDQNNPNIPTVLYNGMIFPLQPLAIKGAIWYQGESNAGRAYQYRELLPTMIGNWRTTWNEGPFPFFIVQLANWQAANPLPGESDWAELREAQTMTSKDVKNVALALAIDIGDAADIHPKDKQDVGLRLALAALHTAYGQKLVYSGPSYKSMRKKGDSIVVSFDHADGGLKFKGDSAGCFAVAGADHKFYWADASIVGSTIVVKSSMVSDPVAVRYAWANNPKAPLYNGSDLPAVPFRTDKWQGVTFGRK